MNRKWQLNLVISFLFISGCNTHSIKDIPQYVPPSAKEKASVRLVLNTSLGGAYFINFDKSCSKSSSTRLGAIVAREESLSIGMPGVELLDDLNDPNYSYKEIAVGVDTVLNGYAAYGLSFRGGAGMAFIGYRRTRSCKVPFNLLPEGGKNYQLELVTDYQNDQCYLYQYELNQIEGQVIKKLLKTSHDASGSEDCVLKEKDESGEDKSKFDKAY